MKWKSVLRKIKVACLTTFFGQFSTGPLPLVAQRPLPGCPCGLAPCRSGVNYSARGKTEGRPASLVKNYHHTHTTGIHKLRIVFLTDTRCFDKNSLGEIELVSC